MTTTPPVVSLVNPFISHIPLPNQPPATPPAEAQAHIQSAEKTCEVLSTSAKKSPFLMTPEEFQALSLESSISLPAETVPDFSSLPLTATTASSFPSENPYLPPTFSLLAKSQDTTPSLFRTVDAGVVDAPAPTFSLLPKQTQDIPPSFSLRSKQRSEAIPPFPDLDEMQPEWNFQGLTGTPQPCPQSPSSSSTDPEEALVASIVEKIVAALDLRFAEMEKKLEQLAAPQTVPQFPAPSSYIYTSGRIVEDLTRLGRRFHVQIPHFLSKSLPKPYEVKLKVDILETSGSVTQVWIPFRSDEEGYVFANWVAPEAKEITLSPYCTDSSGGLCVEQPFTPITLKGDQIRLDNALRFIEA